MAYKQIKTPNLNIEAKGGWCLKYVYDSLNITSGRQANARAEWAKCKERGTARTGEAPSGVYVPIHLSISPSVNDHIAWLTPDGKVYSTTKVGTYKPAIIHQNIAEMIAIYKSAGKTMTYLGYSTDVAGVPVIEEVADSPVPSNVTVYGINYINDSEVIGRIASFMRAKFPLYTSQKALGNKFGPYITASIKEFQRRTGLEQDGNVGPITLAKLKEYGFNG